MTPLDLRTAIAQRTEPRTRGGHGEDALTATYHVVEALPEADCAALLHTLTGPPLAQCDADVAQMAAARLGVALVWRHCALSGETWEEGRRP